MKATQLYHKTAPFCGIIYGMERRKRILVIAFSARVASEAFAARIEIAQDYADALYKAGEETDA